MTVSSVQKILGLSKSDNSDSQIVSNQSMGKEDFLKLLITQLSYQDPLEPVENQEFIAQTAQFSSLEQMQNLNESFKALMEIQKSIDRSLALTYVGKNVEVSSGVVEMRSGKPVELNYEATEAAETVTIRIFDGSGEMVRKIETKGTSLGEQSVTWDGLKEDGQVADDGTYRYEVVGIDENGNEISFTPSNTGQVSGVRFKDGTMYLVIDGELVPQSNVVSVEG